MKTTSFLLFLLPLALFALCAVPGCAEGASGFGAADVDAASASDDAADESWADDATMPLPGDDAGANVPSSYLDEPSPSPEPDGNDAGPADAPPPGPPFDAGEGGTCAQPFAPGDLTIVELLIESTSGTGDHGEWVEVTSTLGCAADLKGLRGECPTGAKVNTFAVEGDAWIPAGGSFVIADSSDPAVNHDLPGLVIPWSGAPGDVLRNEGATVTLLQNGTILDSVTYPNRKLTVGTSLAFPRDCPASVRADWTTWQSSTGSWFPAFQGTPNAPNDDVHCPTPADE